MVCKSNVNLGGSLLLDGPKHTSSCGDGLWRASSATGLRGALDLDDLGLDLLDLGLVLLDLILEAGAFGTMSARSFADREVGAQNSHLLADELETAVDGALGVCPVLLEQDGADELVDGLVVLELGKLLNPSPLCQFSAYRRGQVQLPD